MVRIPNIKIPSVRVGSIVPTSNIGTGGATPVPPTPITYLTQWKIVGNSEVHTLPYPDGVILPNGYKRCKYLEAHGTEYIELPIVFDNTDEIELTVSFTQINLSNTYAIVPKTWNDNNNRFGFGMHRTHEGDVFCVAYGTVGGIALNNPIVAQDTNVHLFTYTNYLFKLDNSSIRNVSIYTFGGTTSNLKLFYGYNSPTKCRIYTYHQVKANNTEINLIPCLDDNDIPCLYDTVSGTSFYNDGTGTFGYEVETQQTEIWSCGEYNPIDGKYHILVKPQGGSIADIALDAPLRKVNDVADTIEFPSSTDGKALVTRNLKSYKLANLRWNSHSYKDKYGYLSSDLRQILVPPINNSTTDWNAMCNRYSISSGNIAYGVIKECIGCGQDGAISVADYNYIKADDLEAFKTSLQENDVELIITLIYPTTELVDAPQIEEADSYSCVISQGGKAVEWSSFETE